MMLGNAELRRQLRAVRMSPKEIGRWLAYSAAQQFEEDGDEDMLELRDAFLDGEADEVIAELLEA